MDAIVASSVFITSEMAGDFMRCFYYTVENAEGKTDHDLSLIHFQVQRCLWKQKYKAHALKYALLGNGALRICLPQ